VALFDMPLDQLERYAPDVAEPADLDSFWAETLGAARAHTPVERLERVTTGLALVETWDLTFRGYDGHLVRGWFSRPRGTAGTALPVVVELVGYGRGRGLPHERLLWTAAGYAHLLVDSRGQGAQYGNGGDTPDPVGSGPATPGFATRGILDPRTYYYRRLVADAVRAVDAVRTLDDVDPAGVVTTGNSQGGGMALAVAGLVPDLAAAMPHVPFLCHVERALGITDAQPYGEIVQFLSVHRGAAEAVRRTLSYVDGVVLGRRAHAPALFGVGLRDTVCPPSTVFAAYNQYAGPREIEVYPFNHHEGGDAFHTRRQLEWLARVVPTPLAG
jgi:cephalosporin-C deacetylase